MEPKLSILLSLSLATLLCCGPAPGDREAESGAQITSQTSTDGVRCWTDDDCPDAQFCQGAFICPPGALCGPRPNTPGKCADRACTPAECGPEPDMPILLCEDGIHYSGPSGRCLRGDDGRCYHEILSCPDEDSADAVGL